MELITGRKGEAHITPMLDAMWHQAFAGVDSCVFDAYDKFSAEAISNNEIVIHAGVGMFQGRFFVIPPNTTDAVVISNGTQSENRIDVIAVRFTNTDGIDNAEWLVVKGTPTTGTAARPNVASGSLEAGDAAATYPMFAVNISGISITGITALFDTLSLSRNGHSHSAQSITSGTLGSGRLPVVPLSKGGTGSGTELLNAPANALVKKANGSDELLNYISTKAGAFYASSENGTPMFGTLPVNLGGTGATTAAKALEALGGSPKDHSHDFSKITRQHVVETTDSGTINWYVEKWNGVNIRAVGVMDLVLNFSATQTGTGWYKPTAGAIISVPDGFENYIIKDTSVYVISGSSTTMITYPVDVTEEGFTVWTMMASAGERTIKLVVEIENLVTV